jgi:hypothetical protein
MSTNDPTGGQTRQPTEEELRAAYEAELKRLRVEDVILQTVVSLLNLGGRKAGLVPGTEDERDLEQVRTAIEGVRALLPLIEPQLGPDANQLREALSQLQLAYTQLRGEGVEGGEGGGPGGPGGAEGPESGTPQEPAAPRPGDSGPAQRSGRLWVPGQ